VSETDEGTPARGSRLPAGVATRFFAAKLAFRGARAVSRALRHRRQVPPPPSTRVALPQRDDDPGRADAILRAREEYALAPITSHGDPELRLAHRTLTALPRSEVYPPLIRISKTLLGIGFKLDVTCASRWSDARAIGDLYRVFGAPPVRARSLSDAEFARQRLQGPNPTWIRAVAPGEREARGLRAATAEAIGAREGETLFALDYRAMLEGVEPPAGRHLSPCVAWFRASASGGLCPIGIELGREGAPRRLFLPDGSPAWQLAKMNVQCADIWVHEIVTHFLWTHVIQEKFILATARNLSWSHPVRRILAPHFELTLNLNRNGIPQLVGEGGFFDSKFSPGRRGKQLALERGEQLWRYSQMFFGDDVRARGLDALADYPYRDDGKLFEDVVRSYVRELLALYYTSDEDVRADPEIAAWSSELVEHLGPRSGFTGVRSLDDLERAVSAPVLNVIQHELVNGPQYAYFGDPGTSPSLLSAPIPEDPAAITEATLVAALPDVGTTLTAILATYGFSMQYNVLANDLEKYHEPLAFPVLHRFRARLRGIEEELERRNGSREVPYVVAFPSGMANSIGA
jgi:hypothetical protein